LCETVRIIRPVPVPCLETYGRDASQSRQHLPVWPGGCEIRATRERKLCCADISCKSTTLPRLSHGGLPAPRSDFRLQITSGKTLQLIHSTAPRGIYHDGPTRSGVGRVAGERAG